MAGERTITATKGCPVMLGANRVSGKCFNFAAEIPRGEKASLLLYQKGSADPVKEICFPEEYRMGNVCSLKVEGISPRDMEYNFRIGGEIVQDPCAYRIIGREHFGESFPEDAHAVRCGFLQEGFYDWEGDASPGILYEDMILYKLHVRGYTMEAPIARGKRGTFAGLMEMIPYWKELGINGIELMPAYEFMEVQKPVPESGYMTEKGRSPRVNYWGYLPGYYFAPKRSYCAGADPVKEFKNLVKALHKAEILCFMEFYFPVQTPAETVLHALQFWKSYYHVDGFHLTGEGVPQDLLQKSPVLADTFLMTAGVHDAGGRNVPALRNLAQCNDGFLQTMRCFLKSDEDMMRNVVYHIGNNNQNYGVVNYMVSQNGFTLADLVTYNYKYNEANGENNRDGNDYNYSWNCGVEGPSKKASIKAIRLRQMKNAFLLLLLSQGTPMLYAGDEFGNSQDGNNNAYCQDNSIGWVNWKNRKKNRALFAFVKQAIAYRKAHGMLHLSREWTGSDYKALGYPDVSLHGERAWFVNYQNTSRLLGIMYNGGYAKGDQTTIYVAYNFHWESRQIALPNLPGGMKWKTIADTGEGAGENYFYEHDGYCEKTVEISPRTILILEGIRQEGDQTCIHGSILKP